MLYIGGVMMIRSEGMKRLISSFLRYLVAGGLGFVVDYLILFLLFACLGAHYLFSSGVAFTAGLIFVYVSSNKWVFPNRQWKEKQWLEFSIFTIIGLVGLCLTILLMWLFVDKGGWHPLFSKLLTTGIVLMWNFSARKVLLY